jgi:hypothetical protein
MEAFERLCVVSCLLAFFCRTHARRCRSRHRHDVARHNEVLPLDRHGSSALWHSYLFARLSDVTCASHEPVMHRARPEIARPDVASRASTPGHVPRRLAAQRTRAVPGPRLSTMHKTCVDGGPLPSRRSGATACPSVHRSVAAVVGQKEKPLKAARFQGLVLVAGAGFEPATFRL